MLKLHGMPVSNFCNIVKQALLEKNIPFEEEMVMPNQDKGYLTKSPMGKIPALETSAGFIAETNVILDYLEDTHPTPRLYPADPFERAKVKQLIKTVEMYIESPAHGMINCLFGGELPDYQRETGKPMMQRGLAAVKNLAKFSPWICGEQFTYADIFTYHAFSVVRAIGGKVYDWDACADVPGLPAWMERMAQRPITAQLDSASRAALQAIMAQQKQAS